MLIVKTCRKSERNGWADAVCLSRRQLQLAELVSRGQQNKEIAADLGITEGTVKVYLSNLFGKLGLYNRASLSAWAVRHADEMAACLEPVADGPGAPEEAPEPAALSATRNRSGGWRVYALS